MKYTSWLGVFPRSQGQRMLTESRSLNINNDENKCLKGSNGDSNCLSRWDAFLLDNNCAVFRGYMPKKTVQKKKVVYKSSWYDGTTLEPVLLGSYRKDILSLHFEVRVIPPSLFRYPISVPWTKRFISQFHSLFLIKKANRVLAKCYPTSPACWSLESPTTNTEIYTGLIAQS